MKLGLTDSKPLARNKKLWMELVAKSLSIRRNNSNC